MAGHSNLPTRVLLVAVLKAACEYLPLKTDDGMKQPFSLLVLKTEGQTAGHTDQLSIARWPASLWLRSGMESQTLQL